MHLSVGSGVFSERICAHGCVRERSYDLLPLISSVNLTHKSPPFFPPSHVPPFRSLFLGAILGSDAWIRCFRLVQTDPTQLFEGSICRGGKMSNYVGENHSKRRNSLMYTKS